MDPVTTACMCVFWYCLVYGGVHAIGVLVFSFVQVTGWRAYRFHDGELDKLIKDSLLPATYHLAIAAIVYSSLWGGPQ